MPEVAGYRPLSPAAVERVNRFKAAEERILREIDALRDLGRLADEEAVDIRWLAIAQTQLQLGFMALNRAVFRPGRVALPEDDQAA